MTSAINWFEIPVGDMDRAVKFYNTILGAKMEAIDGMGTPMAFLPSNGGTGGSLVQGKDYTPSQEGSLVYLNGGDDLSTVLDKVDTAGGRVLMSKTSIGEHGFVGMFVDSEGNRIGLHSMS